MADGMNKPAIRFAGFTDAWERRKLGDIFKYEQPQAYMLGNSVRFQNCLELPVGMFSQLHKQKRRKQTKSLIRSILHRPKIKG